ncbi:hypothetical protein GCM10010172_00790 [Paractinoplanes ferrugineus]|uniref:Uncharacterized protein n=1 Tax=Paractinoplanes ferrugineus TaxID=113564 RepID=A0A919JB57_9ACTN|nr:hypothetical protein Afe05nite_57660 [Actinoplanes ferrugineus]
MARKATEAASARGAAVFSRTRRPQRSPTARMSSALNALTPTDPKVLLAVPGPPTKALRARLQGESFRNPADGG